MAVDFIDLVESRRKLIDDYRTASDLYMAVGLRLAEAENIYRKALTREIARLHLVGMEYEGYQSKGLAITACSEMAHGTPHVADLRLERDQLQVEYKAIQKNIERIRVEINIVEEEIKQERYGK